MTDTRDWIPLEEALKQITWEWVCLENATARKNGVCGQLLEMMAVPLQSPHLHRHVRRVWLEECRSLAQEASPLHLHGYHAFDWDDVCMPARGWEAFYLLHSAISANAQALEAGVQEVFLRGPGDGVVHQLSKSGNYLLIPKDQVAPKCRALGSSPSTLLTKNYAIVTCIECLALRVEEVLG